MSRFGDDPRQFFDNVYDNAAPWDVGGAQPSLSVLFDAVPLRGPVLDVGCGTGDLAISIAQTGLAVLGVDFAEEAIRQAREKAAALPLDLSSHLEFSVADAHHPEALGLRFGSIVDSGFFHLFDPAEATLLAERLATALLPGGRYYLLAFGTTFPIPHAPRGITEDELRERFSEANGWRVLELRAGSFLNRAGPPVPAVTGCFERIGSSASAG
jgi:SAM-dependent methyltransferase